MKKPHPFFIAATICVIVALTAATSNMPNQTPTTSAIMPYCQSAKYYVAQPDGSPIQRHIVLPPYSYSQWFPNETEQKQYWSMPPKYPDLIQIYGHALITFDAGNMSIPIIVYTHYNQQGIIYGKGSVHEGEQEYWNSVSFRLGNPNSVPVEGNVTYIIMGFSDPAIPQTNCTTT